MDGEGERVTGLVDTICWNRNTGDDRNDRLTDDRNIGGSEAPLRVAAPPPLSVMEARVIVRVATVAAGLEFL